MVRNRYKDALRTADQTLRTAEQNISRAFDAALITLSDNAWEGPQAETWFHELRAKRASAAADADACIHACLQALHVQPDDVEPGDWRATWSASSPWSPSHRVDLPEKTW
jgi:hypothetical protein